MKLSKHEAKMVFEQSTEANIRHFEKRAVAIIDWDPGADTPPNGLGSGTCITIDNRFFIATAAHVINGCTLNQLFLVPGGNQRAPKHWTPLIGRGSRGGGDDDPYDVAWLEVAPSAVADLKKEFVPLERLSVGINHAPDDWVFFVGYPTAQVPQELFDQKLLQVQPVGYQTETLAPAKWPTNKTTNPTVDIYIDYNDDALRKSQPVKMIHPKGMSGGGIWLANLIPHEGIWSPDKMQLIGIEHASDNGKSYARGTQLQHWLRMLREDQPSLAASIDQLFPTI